MVKKDYNILLQIKSDYEKFSALYEVLNEHFTGISLANEFTLEIDIKLQELNHLLGIEMDDLQLKAKNILNSKLKNKL